jgi:chaperonin GroES
MALKPLNDRIIVEPSEAETRTASGLVLPDSAQEKPQRGRVLAVGPGKRLDNGTIAIPDVAVGDTVLYGKYSGTEVKLEGKEYVILRAEDVLGVLVTGGSTTKAAAKQTKPSGKTAGKPKGTSKTKVSPKSKPAAKTKSAPKAKPAAKPKAAAPSKSKSAPKAKPSAKAKKAAKKGKK